MKTNTVEYVSLEPSVSFAVSHYGNIRSEDARIELVVAICSIAAEYFIDPAPTAASVDRDDTMFMIDWRRMPSLKVLEEAVRKTDGYRWAAKEGLSPAALVQILEATQPPSGVARTRTSRGKRVWLEILSVDYLGKSATKAEPAVPVDKTHALNGYPLICRNTASIIWWLNTPNVDGYVGEQKFMRQYGVGKKEWRRLCLRLENEGIKVSVSGIVDNP